MRDLDINIYLFFIDASLQKIMLIATILINREQVHIDCKG